ncbi:NAD(P)-binding protein, partial [Aureobasidium pullulans]
MVQKLKIAAAGLGRMGARHAINFLHRTPRAELVAAFTPDPKELAWARTNLEPHGVTLYTDYDEMIKQEGLQAVVIGTATSVHAEEAIKAMHQGLHVLCEKPLSTSIPVCKQVLDEALKHPHLKVMCGFSRRFDESYRDAWEKMDRGLIGRPTIIRSQTCDKHDPSGFFVEYAAWSGGVFVDMSVHDIDLALWFFGDDIQVKSVSAYGVRAVQPELAKYNDYDNAMGIVEFWNGRVANFYCSRMMAHGQEDVTEIIGTEGKLTVNGLAKNHGEIHFQHSFLHHRQLHTQAPDIRRLVDIVIEKEDVNIAADATDSLVTLSKGDMRRALNVLQACHASSTPLHLPGQAPAEGSKIDRDLITNETIFDCIAAPHPADIATIRDTLLSNPDVT